MKYRFIKNVKFQEVYHKEGDEIDLDEGTAGELGELVEPTAPKEAPAELLEAVEAPKKRGRKKKK